MIIDADRLPVTRLLLSRLMTGDEMAVDTTTAQVKFVRPVVMIVCWDEITCAKNSVTKSES